MEQKLKKKIKQCIAGMVACVILLCGLGFGIAVLGSSNQSMNTQGVVSKLYTKAIVAALPKSITGKDNGKDVTFYIEENKDYDIEKDEPLKQFLPYYFEGDKRIDLPQGIYTSPSTGETMQVTIGFFLKGNKRLTAMKSVLIVATIATVFALIGLIIFLWYKIWAHKQDLKDAAQYDIIMKRRKKNSEED